MATKKVTKKAAKPTKRAKSAKKKPVVKKPVKPSKSSRAGTGRSRQSTTLSRSRSSRSQSSPGTRKPAKKVVKKKADVSAAAPEKVDMSNIPEKFINRIEERPQDAPFDSAMSPLPVDEPDDLREVDYDDIDIEDADEDYA